MRLLVILLLSISLNLHAQTIINYANFTGSGCVFTSSTDVPATVNSSSTTIKHQTSVGEVDYSNPVLSFVSNSTNSVGSEYKIEYNFKQNYSYSIVVNTHSINNSGATPYLRLKITNSAGSSAICSGPQSIDGTISGSLIVSKSIPNGNYSDQTYTFSSLPGNYPYLTLANIPSSNGGAQTIEISKITITETPPPVSFTLPSTTNVQCGSTTPITFTVTTASNPNNLTITDYTWHLGATPNGWIYNGSPAPATVSTGTTNNITLTPNCGSTLSNIGATVTAGGNTYNTNTSTINVTTPTLSISGNDALCSGSTTYSVANLPCNASVTWDGSPSGIVSLSCTSCNSTTITKTGDGNVTLTATVTSPTCSNLTSPTKTIAVGNAVAGYYNVISNYVVSYNNTLDYGGGSVFMPKNQSVLFSIQLTSTNLSNVSWGVSGTYSSYYSGSSFLNLYMTTPSSSWTSNNATVTLNATGPCGSFSKSYNFQAVANGSFAVVQTSPNPAKNSLNVSVSNVEDTTGTVVPKANASKTNAVNGITHISLYDSYTNALIKQWTFRENKLMNYNLNIAGIPPGLYILKFERDNKSTTSKVIVQ